MVDFDYTGRFLQPGRLYKFKNTFHVQDRTKSFEFRENEILLYIEQWNDRNSIIHHKFLKENGQVVSVENPWTTQLIKYMEKIGNE